MNDAINPNHYKSHPSGIECIEISKHLSGCLAQAFQYVWRCGQKDEPVQELKKALWFIDAELKIRHSMLRMIYFRFISAYNSWDLYRVTFKKADKDLTLFYIASSLKVICRDDALFLAKLHINKMIAEYESSTN